MDKSVSTQVPTQVGKLVLRTLALAVVASLIVFTVLRAIPGNPARVALGVTATEEEVAALTREMGLDAPLWRQYLDWMGGVLRGDFGVSLASGTNITAQVWDRAQVSLILVAVSMLLAVIIALVVGTFGARAGAWGSAVSVASQVGIAVPSFLVGVLLVAVVSVRLGWLPSGGWVPPGVDFSAFVQRLILPVIALTLVQAAVLIRYVRSAMLEVMASDFIRTAIAFGASYWGAAVRHGLRSVAVSLTTVMGIQLTTLVVGAVVIERVFVIPGLGSLLLDAVASRDLVTVQAVVYLLVLFSLLVAFVVELLVVAIDPRLRVPALKEVTA